MDTTQEAGPSSLKTPQTNQAEWPSSSSNAISTPTSSTPSRQTFPRRLSLLQNDTSSPIRSDDSRRTSFTGGPKPLSLGSQSVVGASAASSSAAGTGTGVDTPRRGKRTSLSYIPSPSTSVQADDVQLSRAPSSSSATGRTRTGSISRAAGSRRRPSQASQSAHSDADDWLMSEEDASFSLPTKSMAERDSAKVEALFNDTGYREGITAGKLSTLQTGFDTGFNEVGALLGRHVGLLRGQIAALLLLTSPTPVTTTPATRKLVGRNRASPSSAGAASAGPSSSLPLLASARLEEAKVELRQLAKELDALTLAKLAEPDYEAMEHEREHQDDAGVANGHASRRTPSLTSLPDVSSSDLLRLIAEKERRCFELREELASEEAALKHLRTTWQRIAAQALPYSTSPSTTFHRRDGSTTSSTTSDAAAEAWNSLSSKLPGSLKNQLNNLLESIANVDAPPPEPVEKQSPLLVKAKLHAPAGDGSMLRPTVGGLGVLEEEGSDVGSVALSPRSPRSPAVPELHPAPSPASRVALQPHEELAALAAQDSQALGFSVDANGLAHPSPPHLVLNSSDDAPPPTPPKTEPIPGAPSARSNTWASRRTSVLGSLANLQQKLQTPEKEDGSFTSMLSKRFREARDNASDLLREAERKLGNAMTIDDLLGSTTPSTPAAAPASSVQIRLDEPSVDSAFESSPWYAAAGGRRSSESRSGAGVPSPTLRPNEANGDAVGRLSISSSSSRSSLSLPVRAASPHASPPVGGAPGSAGVFGMLVGSQSDLSRAKRTSGDSWGWGTAHDEDDDWDAGLTQPTRKPSLQRKQTREKDRSSLVDVALNEENTPKMDQSLI